MSYRFLSRLAIVTMILLGAMLINTSVYAQSTISPMDSPMSDISLNFY